MIPTGIGLTALAIALAWPMPRLLARARWPHRDPVTAIVLWQAIGLAGGLSLIGAPLVYGLSPLADHFPTALYRLVEQALAGEPFARLQLPHLVALAIAATLALRLTISLAMSTVRTLRQRQQHREAVSLVAQVDPERPETSVLDHNRPAAYCVPGSPPLLVITSGMRDSFATSELDAVIAHEYAHLSYRHDLLALPFTAWNRALPWIPSTHVARASVAQLVEMMADDRAKRNCDSTSLAHAISLAAQPNSPNNPREPRRSEGPRVARLMAPAASLSRTKRVFALLSALALIATPTAALALL